MWHRIAEVKAREAEVCKNSKEKETLFKTAGLYERMAALQVKAGDVRNILWRSAIACIFRTTDSQLFTSMVDESFLYVPVDSDEYEEIVDMRKTYRF